MAAQVSILFNTNLVKFDQYGLVKNICFYYQYFALLLFKVALKRQQAAEDAIALGIRVMATGEHYPYLPQVGVNTNFG